MNSSFFQKYPFYGTITRCTDSGYGFLDGPNGEEFIHLHDHSGRKLQSMLGLEGKQCVFVVGGHPFQHKKQKEKWGEAVIEWRLLDDISPIPTAKEYNDERRNKLLVQDNDQLLELLSADWYVQKWKLGSNSLPRAILKADTILNEVLAIRLAQSDGIENLLLLLSAISNSPWFALTAEAREDTYKNFFQPSDWSPNVFVSNAPLNTYRKFDDVPSQIVTEISKNIARAKTVAIDLESNKKTIWEFGWKNAAGKGRESNRDGLDDKELIKAVEDCLVGNASPCIVGHNLLKWDEPILKEHGISFPEASTRWDTLIASWILEPWISSHALVAGERAHQADADAEACYELFETQISRFGPCLEGSGYDIHSLIDELFADPTKLAMLEHRKYPSGLIGSLEAPTVYPKCREKEFSWQTGCHLELVAAENKLEDPILLHERCRVVAEEQDTIQAKLIYIIVSDAFDSDVEVRLSYLPPWLANDNLRALLKDAHEGLKGDPIIENTVTLLLAEDLFKLSDEDIERRQPLNTVYHEDVAATWQRCKSRVLTETEAGDTFEGITKSLNKRCLLSVNDNKGASQWLLYEPPGLNAPISSWSLLPTIPDWLQKGLQNIQEFEDGDILPHVPYWRDGEAEQLETEHLFVSPDTANRPLYLLDLIHSVLNLEDTCSEKEVLLIGLRWPGEAKQLQHNLVQLGLSSDHSGAPNRKLERVVQKKQRVLACHRDDIPKFTEAAIQFKIKLLIVLDETPLHQWHAIIRTALPGSADKPGQELENIPDLASEQDETLDIEHETPQKNSNHQTILKGNDIRTSASAFLRGWLRGVLGPAVTQSTTCLILDPRLSDRNTARALGLPRRKIPFHSLEVCLDDDRREILFEISFPQRNKIEIPNDYSTYRKFLQESWGYDDFRPGTQKPAIEALIANTKDILLRLPTGAGKSIIFHLPALLRSNYSRRLTVVITPLRALMSDQVEGLRRKHFTETVDYLSGGRDAWVNYEAYQGILDGRIQLIFVAPERFRVARFRETLSRRRRMDGGLEFIVFDEAHCISEWGFEFRPDYLYAAKYVAEEFKNEDLPGNPHRLLLTSATVTQRNRVDLQKELKLGGPDDYESLPADMPHPIQPYIVLESFDKDEDEEAPTDEKFDKIIEILKKLNLDDSAALVFVRRRKDCHKLSDALNLYAGQSGSDLASLTSLPFHAGLPEAVKTEARDLLRDRKVNVLVCTKAFGMGMDIPHIHASIHHRPPTFIEDYLQEVGRIGRDEDERARAGHSQVTATLLYNQNDIERNLGQLADKTVKPTELKDFFGYCLEKAIRFDEVGKAICVVPAKVRLDEVSEFDETQVTNCLFWLERMNVLRIEGRHPPFLDLRLDLQKLREYADGSSLASQISKLLIDIVTTSQNITSQLGGDPSQKAQRSDNAENIFSRVVKGVLRGALALLSPSTALTTTPQSTNTSVQQAQGTSDKKIDVSISMSELMSGCGGINTDELFSGLFELNKNDALSLQKGFIVSENSVPTGPEFWDLLAFALKRLLRPTQNTVEYLPRKEFERELLDWYHEHLLDDPGSTQKENTEQSQHLERRIKREVYRAIATSIKILRYAEVDLREGLSDLGVPQYARLIQENDRRRFETSVAEISREIQILLQCLNAQETNSDSNQEGTFEISLMLIMTTLGENFRIGRIKELIGLIESAGFYGFEGDLDGWVSLVTLNNLEPLEDYNPESSENSHIQQVFRELIEKAELQRLRSLAMVLLIIMPAENRKEYIDQYFECIEVEDLNKLLENTVGDVDEEVLENNPILQDLLGQVRQERFSEEIGRLNGNQLEVCKAQFSKTLLVNAGPGSGKTHVLIMRCAHLIHIQKVDPSAILVLAFNRAVVYEIKDRIRRLFRELGYGNYTNRLNVFTFHSFALRHQETDELYEENVIHKAVHTFAERMNKDQKFARRIGANYKAVLVDEFQDMNEDFYSVVSALLTHCSGGGMVIGDDDQDILTWTRIKWRKHNQEGCPLDAQHYFSDFRQSFGPEEHELSLNYRSLPEIVNRANNMIKKMSNRIDFPRMKAESILSAERTGKISSENNRFNPEESLDIIRDALNRNETVAVLCRTNAECQQEYEKLRRSSLIDNTCIELGGSEDLSLYQLRHCGALLDICAARKHYEFVDDYIWEELIEEFGQGGFADFQSGSSYLKTIYSLVRNEVGRPRISDLESFIQAMKTSDLDRLKAKSISPDNSSKVTVSTINKVKGLEFHTVLVMPSKTEFPLGRDFRRNEISEAAAEEARLYYVAMTRARNCLYIGWGDREKHWHSRKKYNSQRNTSGSISVKPFKRVHVSWPGYASQVRTGLQDYIEQKVSAGDKLIRRNKDLFHEEKQIAQLSAEGAASLGAGNIQTDLVVSNVVRYRCGKYYRENNLDRYGKLDNQMKEKEWFYTVLVEPV